MGFIRLLLIIVALVGCTATPQAPVNTEADTEAAAFTAMPNPYLAQQQPLSPQARTLFKQAQQAMQAQQWQQAKALLQGMTQAYPELSGPYVNLGLVYRRQNQAGRAAAAFKQAIAVNPLNSGAYNQLAILYREQGKFAKAEKRYLQALEVWPHNPVVHRNLGILYDLYMGRFADALRHYQMSQKLVEEPSHRVKGWIVDLQRRMTKRAAR